MLCGSGLAKETSVTRAIMRAGAVAALLLASGGAYADDPTSVLLQDRGESPVYPGPLPEYTYSGICYQGMHSEPYPNTQGFRCARNHY
jgi:hypothetical protein